MNGQTDRELSLRSRTFYRFRILRFLFAAILTAAAFSKWQAFGVESGSPLATIAPQLEWFLIQLELMTGIWSISGLLPHLSWMATVFLFSRFTAVGFMMVVQGGSTCGCLGSAEVNLIWFLLFDLLMLATLFWCLPSRFVSNP